jgi:hypothetical protein
MKNYLATAFAVTGNLKSPDFIALQFEAVDGENIIIGMPRKALPAVLAEIQREVGSAGSVVPMRPDELQLGRPMAVESTQVRPNPDGSIQLILFAKLDDPASGVRSLPLTLNSSAALGLADDLRRHSSGGSAAS